MTSPPKTVGQKMMHFLFHSPTEADMGLPPPKKHYTKEEAMSKIEKSWDHPLHPKDESLPKKKPEQHHEHAKEHHESHRTLGQKVSHFLFHNTTEKDLHMPTPKEHLTKEEALHKIEYAWDHPLHPEEDTRPKVHHEEEEHKPPEHLSKEETMNRIEDAWKHPFGHHGSKAPATH